MKTKYASIIIESFDTIIGSFTSKQIISVNIDYLSPKLAMQDILVMIGIIGDLNGQIYMSMNSKAGRFLTSELLGGMEIKEVDEMVFSAVSELCNMVMGNACSNIGFANRQIEITPPIVINDIGPCKINNSYNISFSLEDLGKVDFDVLIRDTALSCS